MFLRDADLQAALDSETPFFTGVQNPGGPFSSDSAIQAASLDLSIGDIYLPEKKLTERGSIKHPIEEHSLAPGETAVVQAVEEADFPLDLAGIAFPPDAVSKKAVLMTNPGHIDPGYRGPLKFTVINMGQTNFELRRGDRIATVLLVPLGSPCQAGWSDRSGGRRGDGVTDPMLARLSRDFVDFERRAEKVARREIIKGGVVAGLATLLVTVMAIVLSFVPAYLAAVDRASSAERRVVVVEQRLDALEQGLNQILPPGASRATPSPTTSQTPAP